MQKEAMNFGEKFATATRFALSDCLASWCFVILDCLFGISCHGREAWTGHLGPSVEQSMWWLIATALKCDKVCTYIYSEVSLLQTQAVGLKPQSGPWICCCRRLANLRAFTMCTLVDLFKNKKPFFVDLILLRSSCDKAPGPQAFIRANFPSVKSGTEWNWMCNLMVLAHQIGSTWGFTQVSSTEMLQLT